MTERAPARARLLTSLALALLAALTYIGYGQIARRVALAEIPHPPDLRRHTIAVQDQIRDADAKARAHPRSTEDLGLLAMAYHANSFHEHARIAYAIAMRLDKKDARPPYLLGVLEMTTGQNERAITHLLRAAEIDPDYAHTWARLGQISYRRSAYADAERYLRRALAIDPTHPHAGVDLARVLGLKEVWDEAERILLPCVQAHPGYGPGHRMLALVYQALGRTADQKRHEDLGSDIGLQMDDRIVHDLFLQSSTGSVLVTQAQISQSWGNADRAFRFLERAVRVDPDDKDVRLAIGRFLAMPGIATPERLAEAKRHLEIGLRLDPGYVNTRHDYAVVLQAMGDTAAAASQWETILREEPEHAMAWMSLGELRFARKDYAGALRHYLRGLSVPPDTPFSLGDPALGQRRLGQTYAALGQMDPAIAAFERSIRVDPSATETYLEWAKAHQEKGRPGDAAAVYDRAITILPGDAAVRLAYGNFLQRVGRFGEARAQLEAALSMQPNDVRALAALGYVLLQIGETDAAIARLEQAVSVQERFPLAHFHLANAYRKKGLLEDATRHYEITVRLAPGFGPAAQALAEIRK